MIILQKVFVLEANANDMNLAKNQQNLEKQRGAQNTIKKLIVDDKEIIDQTHILEYKENFTKLFKKRKQKTAAEIKHFLRHLNIPKLPEDKTL